RQHSSFQHICDQYYGLTAVPGGGLFILSDPFGDHPKLTDVLADSRVETGRLKGKKLAGGSFLSPELSWDAKTILFAYTEATDQEHFTTEAESRRKWTPENCYHIFKVDAHGSGLEQLTDGTLNDFDPCFLPNGRIAMISERRGGYVRCGIRSCRSFNLCSMRPDGGDIFPLSYHDTNEWQPSVNHEGMIVYTRWDYIDRDTQAAHHIWTTTPDGRDPRAYHGNYPLKLADRPWAEMDIRAIPGSRRYVATAAPHHGQAFGSLIWIDLRVEDDNRLSQVTRLTPEVPFPEAEGSIRENMVYGTPWPLDEDDYLCVYDRHARNHGIYWIDRFGNKELIYRDPAIPCYSPIPVRPRARPPVIPEQTGQAVAATQVRHAADGDSGGGEPPATIALVNVYDSDFQWPEGTSITALRVIELLPKATPSRNKPRVGIAEQSNARAVLGTVPVEADGSAHFEAPAGKLIYFQALDARGMAVQSMRSGTYVHPGERLTCQGCHERKHRSPRPLSGPPAALRRGPSEIKPDCDGSNPFNYVRLVQPVLDRNCVDCHRREKALDLSGTIEVFVDRDKNRCHFTRSYNNLAEKYGFWFQVLIHSLNDPDGHGGSRTVAGRFGARASKLLEYLDERHYGVKLSEEDFHRVVLWLDCNSEFLGDYQDAEAQARGRPADRGRRN
ncbi:MAG: HzsA-related protein, partial [Planctomycetota bacterium]